VIRLECAPVALLELDNPPQNLVTLELTRRLDAAFDRLLAEPDVPCVVVAGADERAFYAGSDVSRSSRSSPAASPRSSCYSRSSSFARAKEMILVAEMLSAEDAAYERLYRSEDCLRAPAPSSRSDRRASVAGSAPHLPAGTEDRPWRA
jgi:enoyl-CoA hydratase/carnithine racemase